MKNILPDLNSVSNEICEIFPLAKHKRLPFPFHNHVSEFPFDLIHCDIWGPYMVPTVAGHKYFLTIVDDCTRSTWVYLMNQFGKSINVFRTDNGLEFQMIEFFKLHGIIHQHSCVETPQQNSVVESKHQHILCVARALRLQSNVPNAYWGDCILTAIHLIDKLPYPLLNNKSPFELLYNKLPDYSHLKVFGCLCFASTLSHNRGKFDPRALKCVFLGYPFGVKGYKLLNLQTRSCFISRDVLFHESVFLFKSLPASIPLSQPDPLYHDCFPDAPPLPITDSIHHSTLILYPSVHIDSTILEEHFIDLPEDLSIFVPNDITDPIANITSSSLSIEPIHAPHSLPASPVPTTLIPRKSTRVSKPPVYLQAYKCNAVPTKYSIANYISSHKLFPSYSYFCNSISTIQEPQFYHQAVGDPNWDAAMAAEIQALELNSTWSLVPLPPNKRAVGCKWVFKIKYKSDGSVERYKARLVAKGYTQQEGLDYTETFSPVAKMVTVKLFLSLAAVQGWTLHQLDVNNAFLHGDLHEEVYLCLPPGLPNKGELVCKLNKSLYGLKQASRQWYSKFSTTLLQHGFLQSKADYSLFTKHLGDSFMALLVYVDDILIANNDPQSVADLKVLLNN